MAHNKSYNCELHEIPGIGPKKIEILKKKYKVKTINDLYKIDIFNTLSIESKSFLIYKPEKIVSYKFIEKVETFFSNNNIKGIIAGSYRRKKPESKDIDFVSHIPFQKIKRILNTNNIDIYVHSQGPDRVGAIIDIFKKRVRIDIWFPKKEERIYYLFYATGNAVFNIIMRDAAKKRGYLLNRHGLFEVGNKKQYIEMNRIKGIKTEKDIMTFLGKRYLKPTERNY